MSIWVVKAVLQKAISFLPGAWWLNQCFQKASGRLGLNASDFADKLEHLHFHLEAYRQITGKNVPGHVLELGTGWYPVLPLGYYLSGTEMVTSIDIRKLLTRKRFIEALSYFAQWNHSGKLPEGFQKKRMDQVHHVLESPNDYSLAELCQLFHMDFKTSPLAVMEFPFDSVDLFSSNNTLEHIKPEELEGIFTWAKSHLNPAAVVSHFIDMSDHFSHLDRRIGPFNFLRFSPAQWKWINNNIQSQNRLRISFYRDLFKTTYQSELIEAYRYGSKEDLNRIKLAPPFSNLNKKDLLITHAYLSTRVG